MALTLRDVSQLPKIQKFRLMAGEGGMDHVVTSAGIADYEFVPELGIDLSRSFEPDSLVISSLLFAKDDPCLIIRAMETLRSCGAAALAYKPVLFRELPHDALEFATKMGFPVFLIPEDLWFEDIIFEIMDAVRRDDGRHLSENNIRSMIDDTSQMSQDIALRARKGISLKLAAYCASAYIRQNDVDPARALRAFYVSKHLRDKILLAPYDGGIFVITTSKRPDPQSHRLMVEEAVNALAIPSDPATIPMSDIHLAQDFGKIFRESYHTWLAGAASGRRILNYTDSGIYRFLIPLSSEEPLRNFSDSLLDGVDSYEETISSYVRNGGDISATAIDLKVHPNTVRYRLARIKELTGDPDQTDHQLFRDLFIAYSVREINK